MLLKILSFFIRFVRLGRRTDVYAGLYVQLIGVKPCEDQGKCRLRAPGLHSGNASTAGADRSLDRATVYPQVSQVLRMNTFQG